MIQEEVFMLILSESYVIGDRWTDLVAAHLVSCKKILVKTGNGLEALRQYQNNEYYGLYKSVIPDFLAEDVNDAIRWIISNENLKNV